MGLEEVVDQAKGEMEQKVQDLRSQFEKYQEEYYKLQGITEGFQATAEQLKAENDLYRQLFKRIQDMALKDDFQNLKTLISGLNVKL